MMDILNLIKNGETQKLYELVESNSLHVNSMIENSDGKNVRVLNAAIERNQYEICDYLLNKGADPNLEDEEKHRRDGSSLFYACHSHVSPNIMQLLIDHDANRTLSVLGALLQQTFDQKKVDCFLENFDVKQYDDLATSKILSYCIRRFHNLENHIDNENPICVQMCKKLIDLGFNVDDDLPLHEATSCLCYGSMKLILEKSNASVDRVINGMFHNSGLTPLHILCQRVFLEDIRFENARESNGSSSQRPSKYYDIIEKDVLRSIKLLVGHSADINKLSKDDGRTAFQYSSIGDEEFQKGKRQLLLELGANIDFPYNKGRTHLIKIIESKNQNVPDDLDALLESSNLSANSFGWDLLTFSVVKENEIFVKLLLERGLNPNLADSNQLTPLHFACWKKNKNIIELLLKHGADVNTESNHNALPIDFVRGINSCEVIELLKEKGSLQPSTSSFLDPVEVLNEDNTIPETIYIKDIDEHILNNEDRKNVMTFIVKNFLEGPKIDENVDFQSLSGNIKTLLTRIADEVRETHPELSFTPVLSGSVSEGTKVTYPDEFDYLLYLDNFQGTVRIIENSCPSGFCRAKGLSDIDKEQGRYFNNEEYLEASKLTQNIYTIINHIASKNSIWDGLGIYLKEGPDCNSSIASMEILWIGPKYRFLPVSIDLVIALEIKDWLPKCMSGKNYNSPVLKDAVKEGCLIVVKPPKDDLDCNDYYGKNDMFRISFSKIETKIFNICPPGYKLGYMLAKALREWVPSFSAAWIKHPDYESHTKPSLPSYYLKNYLFFEMEKNPDDVDPSPIEVAYKIWKAVATALKKGTIMSFFNKNCFVHGDIESQLNNFDSYNGVWDYSDGEFSENDDVDDGKGMLYTDEEGRMQQMMSAMIVKILRDELNIEDSEVDEEDFD
ncbi:uncharacterized protein [Clytia hemisphaerica]|uniref:uncharacterized protein n=1 Tax=Clytia hemisphaerica TaxID=252671 RepID=UPI0034D3FC9C